MDWKAKKIDLCPGDKPCMAQMLNAITAQKDGVEISRNEDGEVGICLQVRGEAWGGAIFLGPMEALEVARIMGGMVHVLLKDKVSTCLKKQGK